MCPSTHWNIVYRKLTVLTIAWTDPENTMLSEKQTQKDTQGVIPLMGKCPNWQTHRHKNWAFWLSGAGESPVLMRTGFLGGMEGSGMNRGGSCQILVCARPLNHSL